MSDNRFFLIDGNVKPPGKKNDLLISELKTAENMENWTMHTALKVDGLWQRKPPPPVHEELGGRKKRNSIYVTRPCVLCFSFKPRVYIPVRSELEYSVGHHFFARADQILKRDKLQCCSHFG